MLHDIKEMLKTHPKYQTIKRKALRIARVQAVLFILVALLMFFTGASLFTELAVLSFVGSSLYQLCSLMKELEYEGETEELEDE